MKWVLIIALYYHTMIAVPVPFTGKEECVAAGEAFVASKFAGSYPRFHCVGVR